MRRPEPDQLRVLLSSMSPERLALVYGVDVSEIRDWIHDLDDFSTREGIETIVGRLMRRVLDIAEDDRILAPRDRISQAKLCMGVVELLRMQMEDTIDTVTVDRPALIAKLRKARVS